MTVLEQILANRPAEDETTTRWAKEYARDLDEVVEKLHEHEEFGSVYSHEEKYGAVRYTIPNYEVIADLWDLEELARTPMAETSWEPPGVLKFTVTPQGSLALEAYRDLGEDERP